MFQNVVMFAKARSNSAKNAIGIRKEHPGKFDTTVHSFVREDYTDVDFIAKNDQAQNSFIPESMTRNAGVRKP